MQLVLNKKIKKLNIFTNGCFYLLHPGHINLFKQIKEIFPNSKLTVGINSNKSISTIKNNRDKIIFTDNDRLEMIRSIKYVDSVRIFRSDTPINLIKELKPDIIVKGEDYNNKLVIGSDIVKLGTFLIKFNTEYSTTSIIDKLRQ